MGFGTLSVLMQMQQAINNTLNHITQTMGEHDFVLHISPKDASDRKRLEYYFTQPTIQNTLFDISKKTDFQCYPYQVVHQPVRWDDAILTQMLVLIDPNVFNILKWIPNSQQNSENQIWVGSAIGQKIVHKGFEPEDIFVNIQSRYYPLQGVLDPIQNHPLLDIEADQSLFVNCILQDRLTPDPFQTFYVNCMKTPCDRQHLINYLNSQFDFNRLFIKDMKLVTDMFLTQIDTVQNYLRGMVVVTLGFGMLMLFMIMGLLIQERMPEMGLRICLGAEKTRLCIHLMREGVVFCLIGSVIGTFLSFPIISKIVLKLNLMLGFNYVSMGKLSVQMCMAGVILGVLVSTVPYFLAMRQNIIRLIHD